MYLGGKGGESQTGGQKEEVPRGPKKPKCMGGGENQSDDKLRKSYVMR